MENQDNNQYNNRLSRRDLLKGLATVPVLGAFAYGAYQKKKYDQFIKGNIASEVNLNYKTPPAPVYAIQPKDQKLRLGIIGFGGRGEHLLRATGFAHPDVLASWYQRAQKTGRDDRYESYKEMEDLNVEVTGICDVFDYRAERAMIAGANKKRVYQNEKITGKIKRYHHYKDLLASKDIDAVIIATPDHWHAKMAVDAAKAGKHVYLEKAMTRTLDEAFSLREAIRESGIIFQLGHQGRQTESYLKAREAIKQNAIGKVNLIEITTNRNDPNGAWVYDIHPEANKETIDWMQFLGNAPYKPFNLKHFFRWRCWWDYGTGLSGDLFTHEFDSINQVMELGIPESVTASGGVYFYKDGREVPDVYHAVCEYPNKDLTLMYSATLANSQYRGKTIMGHDGTMDVGGSLTIKADSKSTKYKKAIKEGVIDPSVPIYHYNPGMKEVDAITSATEAYFAGRGLLYTYREGKRYDTTYLHIKEWLDCIRNNQQPSCNIDRGFEEAIAAHMGTLSYMKNTKIFWDPEKERTYTE